MVSPASLLIHLNESLVSHEMSKTFRPYLTFIAAEHIRESVEAGVQVSSGRSWIEQRFHCRQMEEGFSGSHF